MKVHLGGSDVFRPGADAWGAEVRTLCVAQGPEPILPLDGNETTAIGIFQANQKTEQGGTRRLGLSLAVLIYRLAGYAMLNLLDDAAMLAMFFI